MRTVILGAGLAGLSAAEELARQGGEVLVIEKNPFPGGLACTMKQDGFAYDLGPTVSIPPTPTSSGSWRSFRGST